MKPNKGNVFIAALIFVALALTTAGGLYLLQTRPSQPPAALITQEPPTAEVAPKLPSVTEVPPTTASPTPVTTDETANWPTYTNTKYGYEFKYPATFSLVKGPASGQPDEYFKELGSVSFSGMPKSGDQNAGVVFSITVNPTNSEGQLITCSTNNECLQKWMKVINSTTNQVSYINIANQRIQGFESQTSNKLYKQNNSYYAFLEKGSMWLLSLTANNYTYQEVTPVFNQILATFRFD